MRGLSTRNYGAVVKDFQSYPSHQHQQRPGNW
jgi:hypothetical protein